eukprot:g777.t1
MDYPLSQRRRSGAHPHGPGRGSYQPPPEMPFAGPSFPMAMLCGGIALLVLIVATACSLGAVQGDLEGV